MRSVVCPECTVMVPLPTGLRVPDGGRLISCGRCSTIWRVHPNELPAEPPPPIPGPDLEAAAAEMSNPRRRRGRRIAIAMLVGIMASSTLAFLAFLARHHLAVWVPSSRSIFLAVGAAVKPSSIEASIMGWRPAADGALLVGYRVANATALAQAMPEICVEGRDEDGGTAFRRCFGPDTDKIPPDTVRDAEFLVLDMPSPVRIVELRAGSAPR